MVSRLRPLAALALLALAACASDGQRVALFGKEGTKLDPRDNTFIDVVEKTTTNIDPATGQVASVVRDCSGSYASGAKREVTGGEAKVCGASARVDSSISDNTRQIEAREALDARRDRLTGTVFSGLLGVTGTALASGANPAAIAAALAKAGKDIGSASAEGDAPAPVPTPAPVPLEPQPLPDALQRSSARAAEAVPLPIAYEAPPERPPGTAGRRWFCDDHDQDRQMLGEPFLEGDRMMVAYVSCRSGRRNVTSLAYYLEAERRAAARRRGG